MNHDLINQNTDHMDLLCSISSSKYVTTNWQASIVNKTIATTVRQVCQWAPNQVVNYCAITIASAGACPWTATHEWSAQCLRGLACDANL